MAILAVHYNGVSEQHRILHTSKMACKIFLFSFQFWSRLKIDMMQNKKQIDAEMVHLSYLGRQNKLRATREVKFEN